MNTQSNLSSLNTVSYLSIATRITGELEARGFTASNPALSVGLNDRIAEIIEECISGGGKVVVGIDAKASTTHVVLDSERWGERDLWGAGEYNLGE